MYSGKSFHMSGAKGHRKAAKPSTSANTWTSPDHELVALPGQAQRSVKQASCKHVPSTVLIQVAFSVHLSPLSFIRSNNRLFSRNALPVVTRDAICNGVYSSLFRGESKWGTLKSAGNPRCAVPAESRSICTDRRRSSPAAALQVSPTSDTCQSVAILMNRPHWIATQDRS